MAIERIRDAGRVAFCRADVWGGWNLALTDRGDYRVVVYVGPPEAQQARLDRELGRLSGH